MEGGFGGEAQAHPHHFNTVGKRTLEWDLNDWKWDGDLFMASPLSLNPVPLDGMKQKFIPLAHDSEIPAPGGSGSSNSSSSSSYEVNPAAEKGKRDLEKRRRVIVVEDNNLTEDGAATLALKLGGHGHAHTITERGVWNWEGTNGKKAKFGGSSNRAVCQVEDCGADLSNAKDYHRRHKVCEVHSKASRALVGNVMQRFCQQCSRFHVLQEFDEGKRSCRRRLAGHNKRRRKTNPDTVANGSSLNNDQASGYLLISLLKILSNMHSNRSEQTTDQNLLTHILKSLGGSIGEHGGRNTSALLQEPQDTLNDGTSMGNSEGISTLISNGPHGSSRPPKHQSVSISEIPQQGVHTQDARGGRTQITSSVKPGILTRLPSYSEVRGDNAGKIKVNNFDLNDIYVDLDDGIEDIERSSIPGNLKTSSPSWLQQDSSPPQTGGNSDTASAQSPSSSNGDAQSRTDRIVFKLFGKEPNDFPLVLRAQILGWLSHSPSDIESYIRPGCIVLTIYIRQDEAAWEELCFNLGSSLRRLLDVSDDTFWSTGWVHIRVQHQIAFIYNGQVVVDTYLPHKSDKYGEILSVKPIAISYTDRAQFTVKGFNLSRPATRLLCALEGKYLDQEAAQELTDGVDAFEEHDDLQCVKFSCSIPTQIGRGFFEIEDHGLSSSFFPFIVAEEDVCSDIRMLEGVLDADVGRTGQIEARNQAMEFIQEMGWLLHRCHLKTRLGHSDPNTGLYPLSRFKWLMEFSMDHDWCAVVKKLLDFLLDGSVGLGEHVSLNLALSEMGLMHRAVRRNSRPLVELLLRYESVADESLFRPNAVGPAGLTPLHIAAGKDDSEDVLDALTNDPGMLGMEAWKNARDSAGFTPEDYARLRGHYSYIHLIQKKMIKKQAPGHVVVDVPSGSNLNEKQNSETVTTFEIGKIETKRVGGQCKLCDHKLVYRAPNRSLVYRPAMLSMVAIAAVCVCVALLFKSSPEVLYVFRPFRWELVGYGTR